MTITHEETRVCSACGEEHVHTIMVSHDGRRETTGARCHGCNVGYYIQRPEDTLLAWRREARSRPPEGWGKRPL